MLKLKIETLGCSKNRVDTEHLLAQVEGKYEIVPEDDYSTSVDCLLINTCGFIGDAKEESIQTILEAVERKKAGEIGKLAVFGCLSQRYPSDMPKLIPEVEAWFGARDISPVVKYLGCVPSESYDPRRYLTEGKKGYAYLKISEGCDRRCAYCAIPYIRGKHRSVPMEDLVKEAQLLASEGVRELILIAQDTSYYGLDLYGKRCLGELVTRLSEIEGVRWIRMHYLYPANFPEDVIDIMASNPKVCKYLDIPLQHSSDKMLRMMRRNVDGDWTRKLVRMFRERVPGIVLRTTMIVGHPGETEEEFEDLLSFVGEVKFERLGAFTYSEEEGTYGAENYSDDIPQEVKDSRLSALMELQSSVSLEFNLSRVGSVEEVMVDSISDDVMVCRSQYESPEVDGEILVGKKDGISVGDIVKVKITGANEYDLIAELF